LRFLYKIAPWLCIQNDTTSLYNDQFYKSNEVPDCALVVDSGYSFTHIVPFVMGRPILPAIRRCSFLLHINLSLFISVFNIYLIKSESILEENY
jgi:actin-related protein